MSNAHVITLPVRVVIGTGVLQNIIDFLKDLEIMRERNIGIVTGYNTYDVAGKIVEKILTENNYAVYVWKTKNASIDTAEEIASEASRIGVKVVLGIGGGRSIDIAKYTAYKTGGVVISVPTAPSHDGIASPFASLRGTGRHTSVYTKTPYAIIADIDVISKAPPRLIRAGIGDLLGKLVAVKDWQLAHRLRGEYYGEYAAQLALLSAKHIMRYHELIASGRPEGIRILVEALISSGVAMCIAGSSRPASGSEHLFSHALEQLAPGKALHGELVALGTILMLYLYGDPRWKIVKKISKKVGLPTTASDLDVEPEILVKALTIAHKIRPERYTILGEKGLTEEAAWNLLRETGVLQE
ncbi:MAG: NAD(P)-dependent glycerol-1-phosphate dehydrogenase [Thermoprotei archaeon]